jgi:membrane associated rhomboid family serine protease
MSTDPLDRPQAQTPPKMAAWRWLVWAAFTVLLFNAWAVGWHQWFGVLAYEVPSRAAIAHGHLWTLFTYVLAGEGASTLGQWALGVVGLVFLFTVARLTEAERPHWKFLWLCAACALGGSAAWLPLHWSDGSSLVSGCTVLVLGLLSFWCFTVPDEAVSLRLFGVFKLRPPVFFWLALGLETGAFLSFELPQALGHPGVFRGDFDQSAHLGGMLAGWAFAYGLRHHSSEEAFAFPKEIAAPRAAAVSVGARRSVAAAATAVQPSFASQREWRAEVDRILDKINDGGMNSLSVQERQTLDQAKQILKK